MKLLSTLRSLLFGSALLSSGMALGNTSVMVTCDGCNESQVRALATASASPSAIRTTVYVGDTTSGQLAALTVRVFRQDDGSVFYVNPTIPEVAVSSAWQEFIRAKNALPREGFSVSVLDRGTPSPIGSGWSAITPGSPQTENFLNWASSPANWQYSTYATAWGSFVIATQRVLSAVSGSWITPVPSLPVTFVMPDGTQIVVRFDHKENKRYIEKVRDSQGAVIWSAEGGELRLDHWLSSDAYLRSDYNGASNYFFQNHGVIIGSGILRQGIACTSSGGSHRCRIITF